MLVSAYAYVASRLPADVPNPPAEAPPGVEEKVLPILGWLKWGTMIAALAGALIIVIQMVAGRRGRSNMAAEAAAGIPWWLAGMTFAAAAASIITFVMG